MNTRVENNYAKLKPSLFCLPIIIALILLCIIYYHNGFSIQNYIAIQKDYFFYINSNLSKYPATEYNLTQMGDALISSSFLTIFIVYAPRVWGSLITASLISVIICYILKEFFSVPRPAAVFDHKSFTIIGTALHGNNSLPSGHSITVFTMLTILMYSFLPTKFTHKLIWYFICTIVGLFLVITRAAVGAHHPLDIIFGSIIGYICGLCGIFISRKFNIWNWMLNKKYYPIFMFLFVIASIVIINKIYQENLVIFYLSLISLVVSMYKITHVYVKK